MPQQHQQQVRDSQAFNTSNTTKNINHMQSYQEVNFVPHQHPKNNLNDSPASLYRSSPNPQM